MTELVVADRPLNPSSTSPTDAGNATLLVQRAALASIRICEVTPYRLDEVSGITTLVLALSRRFAAHGHPTTILSPDSAPGGIPEDVAVWEIPTHGPFRNAVLSLRAVRTLWRKRGEWGVLHLHQAHAMTLVAALVARVLGRPAVVTFHLVPPVPRGLRGIPHRIASLLVPRLATKRVFVSERTRIDFRSTGVVIRNGVDVNQIRAVLGPRQELRHRLGLSGFVVAFAGRRAKIKGYFDLLEAIRRLREAGVDVRLLAMGHVPAQERGELAAHIERLGIAPFLVDLGERTDRLAYLSAADAFVLPSYREGFPMALLEAMAAGLPVIATNVGGIPELVTDGQDGLLVPPGTVSALADGIRRLAADPLLASQLGAHALETARSFDLGAAVTSYQRLFNEETDEGGYPGDRRRVGMSLVLPHESLAHEASHGQGLPQAVRATPMNLLVLALDVDLTTQRGEAIHTRELARFLGARGLRVDLVTATPRVAVPDLGVGVHHHTRPTGSDWNQVRFCKRLAQDIPADAIYERRLSPKIAFAVSRLLGVPFVVEVNGIEEEAALLGRPRVSPWRPITFRFRRRMYRSAAAVVAVSPPLASIVRDLHGLSESRVVSVPNGVDVDRFVPLQAPDVQGSLGLSPGRWIVFVGNLVPWQGVDTLLRAFPTVLQSVPDARLAIVGDGILRESLKRLSRDVRIQDHVAFTGTVPHEDVPRYIGASAVCVAPFTRSRNEAIGLSPLKVHEYLACGRPVVASDVPGVAELVRAADAGIVVPPDDPGALADAIARLLANPQEARSMGERGRRFVASECSWARTAQRVEGVLREAVANRSARTRRWR